MVTFLSDYGSADEFVGVVHSVVLSLCPAARIVDLSHDVPAHDVRAGAAMLCRAAPYLMPGVVLAVVDPGVGGGRRAVVLDCGRWRLVGPDNGLLVRAARALGGVRSAVHADDPGWWLPRPAATFDGRDVFGPLAAHLSAGVGPGRLGRPLDPDELVRLPDPLVRLTGDGVLECEVQTVDRFGNVSLSARPPDLPPVPPAPAALTLAARGASHLVRPVGAFSDLRPGELGLLTDSSGYLALVLDRASAAARLAVGPGDRIEIAR